MAPPSCLDSPYSSGLVTEVQQSCTEVRHICDHNLRWNVNRKIVSITSSWIVLLLFTQQLWTLNMILCDLINVLKSFILKARGYWRWANVPCVMQYVTTSKWYRCTGCGEVNVLYGSFDFVCSIKRSRLILNVIDMSLSVYFSNDETLKEISD